MTMIISLTTVFQRQVNASEDHIRVTECLSIKEDKARLACYDQTTSALLQIQKKTVDPDDVPIGNNISGTGITTFEKEEPGNKENDDLENAFGKTEKKEDLLEKISETIIAVNLTPTGKQVLTLSNGQKWMENEPGKRKVRSGERVTIVKDGKHYDLVRPEKPRISVHRIY